MNRRHKANPSFSSSLLDEIYRSIDGGGGGERKEEEIYAYSKKRNNMVACQMDKKVTCQVDRRQNWSSSSSDSSFSGEFSGGYRPKPVRTTLPVQNQKVEGLEKEKSFGKTKSRAMKIYGDLKKVKQPISPGGKLATFLNSLFTAGTPKKAKISSSKQSSFDDTIAHNNLKSKSTSTSTCSSASSFSRSCLSNSSSREKISSGAKRSVRFYPVSVILGQDGLPNEKNETRNVINEELRVHIMEKNRRVEEAARDLLKNYQKKVEYEYFNARETLVQNETKFDDYDDDEDDDAASYASSDLFELDHLSAVEDLPVYETTHLRTNLAIANGLIS